MAFAFLGCVALEGMGGVTISVSMSSYWASRSKRSASSWPMNPAAPVMRTLGIAPDLL